MLRGRALFALASVSCARELPPDLGGSPLWQEVRLEGARDLGFEPRLLDAAERTPAGALRFTDVTEAAGLGRARGFGNQHGVGVGFVDVDGDELPDVIVANGLVGNARLSAHPTQLFRNEGAGTFRDVTEAAGLAFLRERNLFSVAAGDYDGDGDVDLYFGSVPKDILLQNQGDGRFFDVTAGTGAGGPDADGALAADGRSKIAAFGDHDGDGDLDVASASSMLPRPFAYLLRNDGGTFTDVSAAAGVMAHPIGNPCAVMWSDHDNDADPDLWIWNDRGDHILLRNEAGERFTDVTEPSGLDEIRPGNPMGIDAADIDHDGDLDFYVRYIGDNPLLRNNGDGTFSDITHEAGTQGEYGWGVGFEDFDADSFADIFLGQEDELPFILFRNMGEKPPRFARTDVPHPPVNAGGAHNVPVAFADYDRDGRVDAFAAWTDGSRAILFRNETEQGSHRWLHVALAGGPRANTLGIGARVAVKTGDLIQFRDISGGSSRASQNEHTVRFGLGHWTGAEWVAVFWPSGEQTVVKNVEGNQRLRIEP